jgi:choline-sulfatase
LKPEILIIMTDQHAANVTGFMGNSVIRTPNLDQLAASGVVFDQAYTACPVCVPARMSFMTGLSASHGGWFDNNCSMGDNQSTYMHALTLAGYETVLCGRMHFIGEDQRHGFSKRIMGDFTASFPGGHGKRRQTHGAYAMSSTTSHCLRVVGGSDITPVLEYDRAVVERAKSYLDESYETPQCLLVGLFAPHFPFVAPKEDYLKYKASVDLPQNQAQNFDMHPMYYKYEKSLTDEDRVRKARAAYYGLVENIDRQIGEVLASWEAYLARNQKTGIVVYLTDHGESCGEKDLFGKMNFFDPSAKIPLIFAGAGIKEGVRIQQPVSIMDVGATLCELVGARTPPHIDGKSLFQQVKNGIEDAYRIVISEFMESGERGALVPGRMIRYGKWKMIRYKGYEAHDLLFDMVNDPGETYNLRAEKPEQYMRLARMLENEWHTDFICQQYARYKAHIEVISQWNRATGKTDEHVWKISPAAGAPLEVE